MDGPAADRPQRERIEDMLIVHEFTRAEALRTYAFWVFALGVGTQALFGTAYTFHVADIGREAGVGNERILSFFVLALWFSIPTNLLCGYLSERIRLRYILMLLGVAGAGMGWGVLNLPKVSGEWFLVAGMGISWGTYPVLTSVTFARYFGRTHIGAIGGTAMTSMILGSAVGPAIFARVKEAQGSYDPVFWSMIVVYGMIIVGAFFATNPQRRLARAAARGES